LIVEEGLVSTQRNFAKELLEEFNRKDVSLVIFALDSTQKLTVIDAGLFDNPSFYRKTVGKVS